MRKSTIGCFRLAPAVGAVACLLLWLSLVLPASAAEVYRWKDANGVTHYSDSKPDAHAAERIAVVEHQAPVAPTRPVTAPAPAPVVVPARQQQPDILMYSSPTCGWCRKAERYFTARNLVWQTIDVTASAHNRQLFARDGGRGTPLIFIDGQRVSGFNEARLDALLGAAR